MSEAARIARLAVELGTVLQARGASLATAESCTGGGIGYAVTQVAGSSAWFDRGFITYSNEAKMQALAVPADVIAAHGAVSEEVARAMVRGALTHSRAQVAVSVTGIAGPTGGSRTKPVGTVCFGFACVLAGGMVDVVSTTKFFGGDRAAVRTQSIVAALQGLIDLLKIKSEVAASADCTSRGTSVGTPARARDSSAPITYVATPTPKRRRRR